jgi:hypothetical protein
MRFLPVRNASAFLLYVLATGCGSVAALPPGDAGSAEDSRSRAPDVGSSIPDGGPSAPDAAPSTADSGRAAADGSSGEDATIATFRCGSASGPLCDTATQYCLLEYGGGPARSPECRSIPAACTGTPTCACTTPPTPDAGSADTVMCEDNDGEITVSEGCLPCQ